jgi:hypothetical protein
MADSFFGGLAEGMMAGQEARRRQALDVAADVWKKRQSDQEQERIDIARKQAGDLSDFRTQSNLDKMTIAGMVNDRNKMKDSLAQANKLVALGNQTNAELRHTLDSESMRGLRGKQGLLTDARTDNVTTMTPLQKIQKGLQIDQLGKTIDKTVAQTDLLKDQDKTVKANLALVKLKPEELKAKLKAMRQTYDFKAAMDPLQKQKMQKDLQILDQKIAMDPLLRDQKIASTEAMKQLTQIRTNNDRNAVSAQVIKIRSSWQAAQKARDTAVDYHLKIYTAMNAMEDWDKITPAKQSDAKGVMSDSLYRDPITRAIMTKGAVKTQIGAYGQQLLELTKRVNDLDENSHVMHDLAETATKEAARRGMLIQTDAQGKEIKTKTTDAPTSLPGFSAGSKAKPAGKWNVGGTTYDAKTIKSKSKEEQKKIYSKMSVPQLNQFLSEQK